MVLGGHKLNCSCIPPLNAVAVTPPLLVALELLKESTEFTVPCSQTLSHSSGWAPWRGWGGCTSPTPRPPVLLTRRSCNLSFPWIALRGSQASHPGVSQEQNLNYPPFSQRAGLSGSVCGFPGASECHLLGEGLWSGGCGCRENIHGETEIGRERPRAVNNIVGRGKQRIEHTENCIQTT